MSEQKFTPGPWSHKTHPSSYGTIDDGICGPDGEQIRVHGFTLSSSDEAKANAVLIAAAPEMFEALQDAFEMIDGALLIDVFGSEWFEKAHAAIAKATGAK